MRSRYIIYFAFDRAEIDAAAQSVIERVARYAKDHINAVVNIVGHADTTGTSSYNLALSKRRGEAVRDALTKLGISDGQIILWWKGKSAPSIPTGENVSEQVNRSVEITIQ
jgi:outer membrane protein OmpA-like peptidoglycan-associated protein